MRLLRREGDGLQRLPALFLQTGTLGDLNGAGASCLLPGCVKLRAAPAS